MKIRKFYIACIISILLCLNACDNSQIETSLSSDAAKSMLKLKGYDFDEKSFFQAVKNDDIAALKAFFDAGINPNARNEGGETALTFAVAHSEMKTIKTLAEKADINAQDNLGQSPLHLALSTNKEDVFDFLLGKNADVNVGGAKGTLTNQTVLYLAVTRGREDLVQKLLERGANPNIADSEGGIALAEACIGASVNPEIVKMLVDKGADINKQEKNGAPPLIYIASNTDATGDRRQAIVKILLGAGANKFVKDKTGKTALDWAKKSGNKDVLEMVR